MSFRIQLVLDDSSEYNIEVVGDAPPFMSNPHIGIEHINVFTKREELARTLYVTTYRRT